MHWTKEQIKLFEAAAHNPKIASKHGISQAKAKEMSKEGVKSDGGSTTNNVQSSVLELCRKIATQFDSVRADAQFSRKSTGTVMQIE